MSSALCNSITKTFCKDGTHRFWVGLRDGGPEAPIRSLANQTKMAFSRGCTCASPRAGTAKRFDQLQIEPYANKLSGLFPALPKHAKIVPPGLDM